MRVNIKPLSVNALWQGRRFKTPKYKRYETDVLKQLRPMQIEGGNLELTIKAGFSNKSADLDNICKAFTDILQKAYGFNDSRIYQINLTKEIVPKGKEFIEWDINKLYTD